MDALSCSAARLLSVVAAVFLCAAAVTGEAPAEEAKADGAAPAPELLTDLKDVPNPAWEELKKSLTLGKDSLGPALGSSLRVNRELVATGPYADRAIPRDITIHTPTSSLIRRADFGSMTRWYQEDGNTQIFRMFPGDDNVRNQRALAPRSEAFGGASWQRGDGWREWSGRYTFIKVRGGAVFQIKHNTTYWSMQLDIQPAADGTFNLAFQRLHDAGATQVLERDIVGKSYDVRVLDDGTRHRVYVNGVLRVDGEFTDRRDDERNHFRWGFYSPKSAMDREILILVTGVYVGVPLEPVT